MTRRLPSFRLPLLFAWPELPRVAGALARQLAGTVIVVPCELAGRELDALVDALAVLLGKPTIVTTDPEREAIGSHGAVLVLSQAVTKTPPTVDNTVVVAVQAAPATGRDLDFPPVLLKLREALVEMVGSHYSGTRRARLASWAMTATDSPATAVAFFDASFAAEAARSDIPDGELYCAGLAASVSTLLLAVEPAVAQWLLVVAAGAVRPERLAGRKARLIGRDEAFRRALAAGLMHALPDPGALDGQIRSLLRRPLAAITELERAPGEADLATLVAALRPQLDDGLRTVLDRLVRRRPELRLGGPEPLSEATPFPSTFERLLALLEPGDTVRTAILHGPRESALLDLGAHVARRLSERLEPVWMSFAGGAQAAWERVAERLAIASGDRSEDWRGRAQEAIATGRYLLVVHDVDALDPAELPRWLPRGPGVSSVLVLSRSSQRSLQMQQGAIAVRLPRMRYDELSCRLQPIAEGELRLEVVSSDGGRLRERFEPPFDRDQAERELSALELAVREGMRQRSSSRDLEERQRRIGAALYDALFRGTAGALLHRQLARTERQDDDGEVGVRLILNIESEGPFGWLAALPWELLYRTDTRDFLGRRRSVGIVRYLDMARVERPLGVAGVLRVLLLTSSPPALEGADFATERQRIELALRRHPDVELRHATNVALGELRALLRENRIHVLHFMGYGTFTRSSGEGALVFAGDRDEPVVVTGRALAEHLRDLPALRLLLLSTCESATSRRKAGQEPYGGVARAAVVAGVPAAVAMQFSLSDAAAIAFSDAFYRELAHSGSVDAAIAEGRLAIFRAPQATAEWANPTLLTRLRDGQVFTTSSVATGATPLRLGIRSHDLKDRLDYGSAMDGEADRLLDLSESFDGRVIRAPNAWAETAYPRLRDFLEAAAAERRPLHLELSAHATLAFAAGYVLEAKSGLDVRIRQRGRFETRDWWAYDGDPPGGALWRYPEDIVVDQGRDVAVAVSVTGLVIGDVQAFVRQATLPVRRIMPVEVTPEPGPGAVRNGAHASLLAQRLANQLCRRPVDEREGTLHLFVAAPNAFLFFLGQLARGFGRVQLYEYDFDEARVGGYRPSLRLPPG